MKIIDAIIEHFRWINDPIWDSDRAQQKRNRRDPKWNLMSGILIGYLLGMVVLFIALYW